MPENSQIMAVMAWLQALLLGGGVITAAVLGAGGLGLFIGRRHRRAGLRAAMGVGIVFSAARIAYGMLATAQAQADAPPHAVAQLPGRAPEQGQVVSPSLAVEVPG